MPRDISVDAGYADAAEAEQYANGFTTLSDIYGKRSQDWREQIRQRVQESEFIAEECAKAGVDPSTISGMAKSQQPEQDKAGKETPAGDEEDPEGDNSETDKE